jgi:hypothetical protein
LIGFKEFGSSNYGSTNSGSKIFFIKKTQVVGSVKIAKHSEQDASYITLNSLLYIVISIKILPSYKF